MSKNPNKNDWESPIYPATWEKCPRFDCVKFSFMKEVLGETAFNNYIELKAQDLQISFAQVSPWELKRYTAAF